MKQKGINKRILWLIPLMFVFFALSIITATYKTTAATSYEYPFADKRGVNAFKYAWEMTVPEQAEVNSSVSEFLYKPNTATTEDPCYPELSSEGYLALHIKTDAEVVISFTLYDRDAEQNMGWSYFISGTPYLINESGAVTPLSIQGTDVVCPVGTSGAIILPLSNLQKATWNSSDKDIDFASIDYFTARVYTVYEEKSYAGAHVTCGSLSYYASNTAKDVNSLTSADVDSAWKIMSNTSGVELKQVPAVFREGVNMFAYGANIQAENLAKTLVVWYKPEDSINPTTQEKENVFRTNGAVGYFAFQIETKYVAKIKPSLYGGVERFCKEGDVAYFTNAQGDVSPITYSTYFELPAGSKGILFVPAAHFPDDNETAFNWQNITLFVVNMESADNPVIDINLGEVGYYETRYANVTKFTTLTEAGDYTWQLTCNDSSLLTYIKYIDYDMKGDPKETGNELSYGASWSGVEQTDTNSWAQFAVTLDDNGDGNEGIALDKENGVLAVQMEIKQSSGRLLFLPSLWDNSTKNGQSFLTGAATFISVDGEEIVYNVFDLDGNSYLSLPKCKGVLLMNLCDFKKPTTGTSWNEVDWNAVTTVIFTVNRVNTYDFTLSLGEIGYYENVNAAMTKIATCTSIKDFSKFAAFSGSTVVGTLDRIPNKDIAPTPRLASVSASDDIGLLYYVELPNEADETVYGTFTIGGVTQVPSVAGIYQKDRGCFVYIAKVSPGDYTKDVTLYIDGNAVYTTTVQKYANALANTAGVDEKAKALASALIDYCEATRVHFAGETPNAQAEVDASVLSQHAYERTADTQDVTITGFTLRLGSRMMINIYFTTQKPIEELAFSGNVVINPDGKGGYIATVKNIVAKNFDKRYTVQIGDVTVTCSALSYVYKVVSEGTEEHSLSLYNLVVAIYKYNVAADNYFTAA